MSIYQSTFTGQQIDERLRAAENINPHILYKMNTESGIHGIRYWHDTLEYYDGTGWVEIETGGGSGSITVKTASQWASENPILLLGELGIESDTNKIKIGNGTARWNSLPYMTQGEPGPKGDPGEDGQEIQLRVNGGYIQWSYAGGSTWSNLIAVNDLIGPPGPEGDVGPKGDTGNPGSSIQSIARTSGTGAPGTTDTYTVTLTDGATSQFFVYNGADGLGAGDMQSSVYDPQGKATNIFAYVDNSLSGKVDKVDGKGLSANDYTTSEKDKLASIADNANNYTHPTTPGNKHIPAGGSVGQILKNTANGTAEWADNTGGSNQAVDILIEDAGEYFPTKNVEAALQHSAQAISTKADTSALNVKAPLASPAFTGSTPTTSGNMMYHVGNITVSTTAPSSALAEGHQHQVY